MAIFDYAKSQATATRLIKKFGTTGTLRTRVKSGGTDYKPTYTSTNTTVDAVLLDYEDRKIDGDKIQVGDRLAFVSAANLAEINTDATLTYGGKTYQIVKAKKLDPAGTTVFHELQLRI